MANIAKRNPLSDLANLHEEMNELFRDFWRGTPRTAGFGEGVGAPAVDIEETGEGHTVTVDLPGIPRKDIRINLESNVLSIQGGRKCGKTEKKRGTQRTKRACGMFYRSFALPASVDAEGVKASCKNGVLSITVPKREGRPRR